MNIETFLRIMHQEFTRIIEVEKIEEEESVSSFDSWQKCAVARAAKTAYEASLDKR